MQAGPYDAEDAQGDRGTTTATAKPCGEDFAWLGCCDGGRSRQGAGASVSVLR